MGTFAVLLDTDTDTAIDTGDTETGAADTDTNDSGAVDSGDTDDSGAVDSGDTDSDTDTDTGSACATGTEADLVFTAEARDNRGGATSSFGTDDIVTVAGVVTNPCTTDIVFSTSSTCLVTAMTVSGTSGMGSGVSFACGGSVTLWTVPAGGSIDVAEPLGTMAADRYTADVTFNLRRTSASTTFTVFSGMASRSTGMR